VIKNFKKEVSKITLFYGTIFCFLFILFAMPRLGIPLSFSYVLYLIFKPAIAYLMKLGLKREAASSIVFCGILFILIFPFVKFLPTLLNEVQDFTGKISVMEEYVTINFHKATTYIKDKTGYEVDDQILGTIMGYGKEFSKNALRVVPNYIAYIFEWIFVVPLLLFFLLRDMRAFRNIVYKNVPNTIFERFHLLSYQFNKQLGDYIFAKFIEATLLGFILSTGLMIMGVRYSVLFGLFAGLTNIIPYVGPIFGAIPLIAFGLSEYGLTSQFGAMMLLFGIAYALDFAIIFPLLVSKIVDLHPVSVVIGVILGSQFYGMVGMIISIPVIAAMKLILSEIYVSLYPASRSGSDL